MVRHIIQAEPAQILTLMEYQRRPLASERNHKEMDSAGMVRVDPVVKIGTRIRLPFEFFCQFSLQCLPGRFTRFNGPAKKRPVTGIDNTRCVISQLQQIVIAVINDGLALTSSMVLSYQPRWGLTTVLRVLWNATCSLDKLS